MKLKIISFCTIIICMLPLEFCESKPNDSDPKLDTSIPAIFLKLLMYINRMFTAPILSRPDYVCERTLQEKDDLCKLVFNQEQFVQKYKVKYGENLPKNEADFECQLREFNCYCNKFFHLGLSQKMLLCPVIDSETEEKVTKYLLCTNYSSGKVLIFKKEDDGRVVATAAISNLKLSRPKPNEKKNEAVKSS